MATMIMVKIMATRKIEGHQLVTRKACRICPARPVVERFGLLLVGGQAGRTAPIRRAGGAQYIDINGIAHPGRQAGEDMGGGRVLHDDWHDPGQVGDDPPVVIDRALKRLDPGRQVAQLRAMPDHQSLQFDNWPTGSRTGLCVGNPLKSRLARSPLQATYT